MLNEVDNFFLSHFNIVASVILLIVGYIKLVQSSKSNGDKLDSVLNKTESMSLAQQDMKLEVSRQGVQMSNVQKEVGEIKNDMRSHDKDVNAVSVRLAAIENFVQLKKS